MKIYAKAEAIKIMNSLAGNSSPFFFMVSFDCSESVVIQLEDMDKGPIFVDFGLNKSQNSAATTLSIAPESLASYQIKFDKVSAELNFGNTFLINLACETKLQGHCDLNAIFHASKAAYKLLWKDKLVCFSPESFIKIEDDSVYAFPMKGTIDASIPNAEFLIIEDEKEKAEHYTIVDLIRNDLGIVAQDIQVDRFRYLTSIESSSGKILQVSSQVSGKLDQHWKARFGDILFQLLPAGSISGAPKSKTVEIINHVEDFERGFYTGVFGIFDGQGVDSAVAIRFIEQKGDQFFYKSGGGITTMSDLQSEYKEMIQKIYVPTI